MFDRTAYFAERRAGIAALTAVISEMDAERDARRAAVPAFNITADQVAAIRALDPSHTGHCLGQMHRAHHFNHREWADRRSYSTSIRASDAIHAEWFANEAANMAEAWAAWHRATALQVAA
jgi:hypothetical protein